VSRARRLLERRRPGDRGQGLVEISLILPVFLLLLMSMLEFGFVFDHNISLTYATREGARVGSALVNGGGPLGCGGTNSPNASSVDPAIITAVDRVLSSPGSLIDRSRIGEIRIYKATSSGTQSGSTYNRWVYSGGAFVPASPQNWGACNRTFTGTPDSIGVSITYTYVLNTPLSAILGFFGGGGPATLGMADRTVMAMNPLD
jgi:hypothetical protein